MGIGLEDSNSDDAGHERLSPGTRPLAELAQVPWESLRTAEGSASDVPVLLCALELATSLKQAQLIQYRFEAIVTLDHQGLGEYVAEVAGPAIPFFLGILAQRPDLRPVMAEWLAQMAPTLVIGTPIPQEAAETERVDPWGVHTRGSWTPEMIAAWAAPSRAALEAGLGAIAPLLDDHSPRVRAQAAYILGHSQVHRSHVSEWLWARFEQEPDSGVQADLLISMSKVVVDPERLDQLHQVVTNWWMSDDAGRRCAAAHAWYFADPTSVEAGRALILALGGARNLELGFAWESGTFDFIFETLESPNGALLEPAMLEMALEIIAGRQATYEALLRVVMDQAFADPSHEPSRSATRQAARKRIIRLFADGEVELSDYVKYLLPRFGLPVDRSELGALLESGTNTP